MFDQYPIDAARIPIDAERTGRLCYEYRAIFNRVGVERFTAAVDSLLADRPYNTFPTIGEFRQHIPSEERPRHSCSQCQDGFVDAGEDASGNRQVALCPNRHKPGEPEGKFLWALMEDRTEHPEKYFGVPDVVCMMRAQYARLAAKQPLYSSDELFKIVERARAKYGPKFETAFNVADF